MTIFFFLIAKTKNQHFPLSACDTEPQACWWVLQIFDVLGSVYSRTHILKYTGRSLIWRNISSGNSLFLIITSVAQHAAIRYQGFGRHTYVYAQLTFKGLQICFSLNNLHSKISNIVYNVSQFSLQVPVSSQHYRTLSPDSGGLFYWSLLQSGWQTRVKAP